MRFTHLRHELDQGVASVTLDRPEVLNSFNRQMAAEMQQAFAAAAADPAVRAVVITGAGRAFCAGQDLAEAMPQDAPAPDLGDIVTNGYNPVIRAIRQLEKPVICAVNGVAAGAGANLALACDFVIAAREASFIQSFARIGLVPDSGGTFVLPRLVGFARATSMMMLAEKVTAEEALAAGMIYRVVDGEKLADETAALARQLAIAPTRGLGLIKRALNASAANGLEEQLAVEAQLQREAGTTEDYQEGVRAFLEKRRPTFTGR